MGSKSSLGKKPLKSPKKRLKTNRKAVVKKLDAAFSKYIRLSASKNGMVECYTCGKLEHWKKIQCGHFFTRGRYGTRWDEANGKPQCVGCNVFLNGNYIIYTRKMLAELGEDGLDELERKSKSMVKLSTAELMEKVAYYESKVSDLLK